MFQAPSLKPQALLRAIGVVSYCALIGLGATVVLSAQASKAPASKGGPFLVRKTTPPLPVLGFAPVRPMEITRATYDFAAQHPEILQYVPCFCGCGSEGHKSNESCFIAKRDKAGNVLEWDTHGFGCLICIDVAREAMQMYTSGAGVQSIRAAIQKKWSPSHPGTMTPTPMPPAKPGA